jgi:hypothetical protein
MAKDKTGTHSVIVRIRVPKTVHKNEHVRELINADTEIEAVKFPLRPGGAIAKGSQFEREFGKKLSLWWSNGEDAFIFSRRGGSGGSFRDKKGHSGSSGDIMADKPSGEPFTLRYSVELKFYADLTNQFWSILTGDSAKTIENFWEQCCDSAKPYNRYGLLILRCNGKQPIVLTNDPWFISLSPTFQVMVGNYYLSCLSLRNFFELDATIFSTQLKPPEAQQKRILRRQAAK